MEKLLPQNIEAEMGVLGSLIIDPDAIVDVGPILKAEDFYRDAHRLVFEAIAHLWHRHEPADFLTLCEELEHHDHLEDIGGASYLTSLINGVPTSGNAKYYADIVARKAELREIIRAAGKIAQMAYDEESDALSRAEKLILEIGQNRAKQDFESMEDYMPTYMKRLEERSQGQGGVRGISTGLRELDALLGGLQRGNLYIPAARPGVGKTTICQNIAYRAAVKHGARIGFFSVEMSKDDLMDRFMSMHTKINSLSLKNGNLEEKEWKRVVNASDDLSELGIYFQYTPGIYVDDLVSMARRLVQQHKIDLLVIDYLQLLRARIEGKRIQMRELEVAEIARTLKMLAGELQVPVLAPAQINRQVEHGAIRKDEGTNLSYRMPALADLRESGEIEQSADVVMFLARSEEDETKVKLNIAKHRNGPVGDVDLYFEGATTRFMPLVTRIDEYGNVINE